MAFEGQLQTKEADNNRGHWNNPIEFVLSSLGYAVGLGNIWRFPYLVYKHGGGAFLVPYLMMLFFVGIPMLLLEMAIGQFTSQGPTTCWECALLFQGIGVAIMFSAGFLLLYYNVIIAWAVYYFFASFIPNLPWSTCGSWSNSNCIHNTTQATKVKCNQNEWNVNTGNGTCTDHCDYHHLVVYNNTLLMSNGSRTDTAAQQYFDFSSIQVGLSEGIHDIGTPRWDMTLALLLAWVVVFLANFKGVQSSGKVVYFTVLYPYGFLLCLFIYMLALGNYSEGLKYYITPNFSKIANPIVWLEAATQIFFSLSLAFGGMLTLSSYNDFHNDILRDALIVGFANSLTSIFAGVVVFGFLGILAKSVGKTVEEVVSHGPGLVFVVIPDIVTKLWAPNLWSLLFFLMLITLGLDTQFANTETMVTCICDFKPSLQPKKVYVTVSVCTVMFLIGLSMTTPGGIYVLHIIDTFTSGWSLLFISLMECVTMGYIYGANRFANDIGVMLSNRGVSKFLNWNYLKYWWMACWYAIIPLSLTIIILSVFFTSTERLSYGDKIFPLWAEMIGWMILFTTIFPIFIVAGVRFVRHGGTLKERWRNLTTPTDKWGPLMTVHRQLVTYQSDTKVVRIEKFQ